jgi:acetyltransferase-like isoleucine patch superfamily enzyme
MIRFLRILKRKIFKPEPIKDHKQSLIENGTMKVGTGCDISNMQILIYHKSKGFTNIEIGNNCCIKGVLIIYRPHAKITIGNNAYIGSMTYVECAEAIEIGNDVLVSMSCNLIDTNSHSLHSYERVNDTIDWQSDLEHKNWNVVESKKITIMDKCWIGLRSIVMKGVVLNEGTIVGSGSVVTKSTDAFTAVAGNPARKVKDVD